MSRWDSKGSYVSGLDLLRLIAAACVVAIHSFMEYQNFTDAYTVRILTRWAVPFFFMVTGYFLKEESKAFIRFWIRILGMYVFWTIVYALLCHMDIWNVRDFLSALRSGIIMPFWYFPSLLMCVMFVWILIKTVRDPRIIIGICSILYVMALMGHTFANLGVFDFWNNGPIMRFHHRVIGEVSTRDGLFWGSLFVAIGHALRVRERDKTRIGSDDAKKKTIIASIVFAVLYVLEICLIVYYDTGGKDVTLFSIPVTLMLFGYARSKQIPKVIGEYMRHTANGIFLVHYFFLELFMGMKYASIRLFILTFAASITTSFVGTMAVKRLKQYRNTTLP